MARIPSQGSSTGHLWSGVFLCVLAACSTTPSIIGTPADPAALARQVEPLSPDHIGDVVLRGTVGQVCDAGCWFYLLDEKNLVFVQLDLASGLVIPTDSQGEPVLVKGTIRDESGQRVLHAETIVLGDAAGSGGV